MVRTEQKVAKMKVIKITSGHIAKKTGVSKHTVESTLSGRRKNPKVIATVSELNAVITKALKN